MCDAVLKFTLSQSVSHLSVSSREQMKKKVLCLLPITVALHAHPEGKKHLVQTAISLLPSESDGKL